MPAGIENAKAALAIPPNRIHQIFNASGGMLRFLAICAPAWTPDNSVFVECEEVVGSK